MSILDRIEKQKHDLEERKLDASFLIIGRHEYGVLSAMSYKYFEEPAFDKLDGGVTFQGLLVVVDPINEGIRVVPGPGDVFLRMGLKKEVVGESEEDAIAAMAGSIRELSEHADRWRDSYFKVKEAHDSALDCIGDLAKEADDLKAKLKECRENETR